MKSKPIAHFLGAVSAALCITNASAAINVNGTRNTGTETEYSALAVQGTVSNWSDGGGAHEALANIHAAQDGNDLALHLAARVTNRSILFFIDSKTGGRTFIPNNLINYGGEENYINNLGSSSSAGMTFETGFTPDYAIRIFGNGADGAFVNIYDLSAGTRTEAGNAGAGVISKGFITQMRANNLGTGSIANNITAYAAATDGVEMKLSLSALGIPSGAQSVKLMALLVDTDSIYGSNQLLATRSSTGDIGTAINSINFQSEANTQTLSFNVTGPASREVVFNVNMTDEITKGNFSAASNKVKVLFFSGLASTIPGEMFLTDDNADSIYTGSLMAEGAELAAFGNYKFFNTKAGAPNSGYEYGADRDFNLGPLAVTQTLSTVMFRPNSFAIWSGIYSGGQSATQDRDGDGMKNGLEYFMGSNNSQFTANPQPVTGIVSWPRDPLATGATFRIRTSPDLSIWTDVTTSPNVNTTDPNFVRYTLPTGETKIFVRFEVIVP